MTLRDLPIKSEYRTFIDDVVVDFYVPLLSRAVSYRRAVGFFSSSVLVQISQGVERLMANGGTMQIVASPHLSEEDIIAIRRGYERRDEIVRDAVLRELTEPKDEFEKQQLNLLAHLIASRTLDIKIAVTENEKQAGMYHEKMGIISDVEGNAVAFSGSLNETQTALSLNYEAIDVFCSWMGEGEAERVRNKEAAFTAIWNNTEPNIKTIAFPELRDEIIRRYKTEEPEYWGQVKEKAQAYMPSHIPCVPPEIKLHDYQIEAIDNWEKAGFRGIFDMATGTGKTFTGLGAVVRLCEKLDGRLAVFIVAPFQHLIEQWVEDIEKFNIKPIIGYSASQQRDWLKRLENAILDQKIGSKGKDFFLFICTNATFATDRVQNALRKIRGDVLLVVDEAHNIGSARARALLTEQYKYRLALSATIDRHNDEEGTEKLLTYFGGKCFEYSLEQAVAAKKLTEYYYTPIITHLNDEEFELYAELTHEIGKCMIVKDGKCVMSERGKRLALKRARVVAGARNKLPALETALLPFKSENYLLVYCGATNLLPDDSDLSDTDKNDIRQIEAVSDLLGNKLGMKTARFTSQEDMDTRKILKEEFTVGGLQALVAIRCLDEGVNIPAIRRAFILASTTNPKEYIQRRGRVLRLSEGKQCAYIYDFITLPHALDKVPHLTEQQRRAELSLVKNELKRAEEFSGISLNMPDARKVTDEVKRAYSINDHLITYEEEFV